MKTLYFECNMGAAGDMLSAALLDLVGDPDALLERARRLIPGIELIQSRTQKCGITGNHLSVKIHGEEEQSEDIHLESASGSELYHDHGHEHEHDHDHHHEHGHEHDHDHHHEHGHDHGHEHHHEHGHHHHHTGYGEICAQIEALEVSDFVKENAKAVYNRIAQAEASVHGTDPDHIHFHEVGSLDAVMDVTLFCMLIEELAPDQIIVSPIHVGSGTVRCAHGILPVPAPATAVILTGTPYYSGAIRGELCTPTGAALLTHFADRFGPMPVMRTQRIGYGMGNKDFPVANCVRVFLGETAEQTNDVYEISFNIDDMTAEALAYAEEKFFESGALEAFVTPVQMKKNRSGYLVTVLADEKCREQIIHTIFKHTTTIGIREKKCGRYTLNREICTEDTPFGSIRKKRSWGYGVTREKYEYDDISAVATERGLSIEEVMSGLK